MNKVAIVGGTHGNEFSGIYLLKKWRQNPAKIQRDSFEIQTVFANPQAFEANKRYLDCDMNRQFGLNDLNNPELANYEQSRAKAINAQLGPKGEAQSDFIIDLHNTTSNMGPSLILLKSDAFNRQMAAYVKSNMPDAVIVLEDQIEMVEHTFLCSIAEQGVIVEVGPQPQSVVRQDVLDWMEAMTGHILDFVDLYNRDEVPELPSSFEAYKYHETLKLPEDENGERIGMVHKNVQDADFKPLRNGDPIYTLFDGTEVCWDGDYEAYPHFINEAAYYDNNLAMSLAKKVLVEV
ncbi:aspartoacylase [Photobacterium ganghwense]|uniref:Aspartoacylase n=1 Tax=Photobacterium ganghwense TaxID=320778 RepID=A0A0J1HGA0_9GAMM|nr:aspartoacylase [Photobacterium ganghwense]KLV10594.1 aspartoacylase [Photobacterium ganghwense]PSU09496.1 aspartoacylase [Photobacterium ganghwense]QSV16741.1 aspartoacylase [Photobacterium ganghwense]